MASLEKEKSKSAIFRAQIHLLLKYSDQLTLVKTSNNIFLRSHIRMSIITRQNVNERFIYAMQWLGELRTYISQNNFCLENWTCQGRKGISYTHQAKCSKWKRSKLLKLTSVY